MNNQYDVDFFIQKFSAIPDEQWCVHAQSDGTGRRCALGHTIRDATMLNRWCDPPEELEPEFCALIILLDNEVAPINNGNDPRYPQPTPKARILAALHDAKARAEAALDEYETRKLDLTPHRKEQLA